jgi:hypothetical protein
MLRPLLISVQRDDDAGVLAPSGQPSAAGCLFCGAPLGLHAEKGRACAICLLVRHLERPRIDEEARLVWIPEMSQAALVCLLREMHCRLRSTGEGFCGEGGPAIVSQERATLHYARVALNGRGAVAVEHLGTERPSELAHVLARMARATYERRHRLLGGLRVLPAGRFFVGATNVYPAIVDSWLNRTARDGASPAIREAV